MCFLLLNISYNALSSLIGGNYGVSLMASLMGLVTAVMAVTGVMSWVLFSRGWEQR